MIVVYVRYHMYVCSKRAELLVKKILGFYKVNYIQDTMYIHAWSYELV